MYLNMIKMKKNVFKQVLMAVFLSLPMLFSSCSHEITDEDTVINNDNSTLRMEITLSGDYAKFTPHLSFDTADLNGQGMIMHTSTGENVKTSWAVSYDDTLYPTLWTEIRGAYILFLATILFTNTENQEGSIHIQAKVYRNNTLIRKQEEDINIETSIGSVVTSFSPDKGFSQSKEEDYNGK